MPPRDRFRTFFHESYRRWAADRWRNGVGDASIVEAMIDASDRVDEEDQLVGLNALMLVGAHEAAVERSAPLIAFLHFDMIEQVDDALRALGLDPAQPDYREWAAAKCKQILADPDETEAEQAELIRLCAFLEARGLEDEAKACLEPWISGLAGREDDEVLLAVIDRLVTYDVVESGIRLVAEWAGDNEQRWEDVSYELLGGDADDRRLWEWLGEDGQDLRGEQRLRALFGLLGVTQPPDEFCREWIGRLRAAAEEEARGLDRRRLFDMLCDTALAIGDLELALKSLRELGKDQPRPPRGGDLLMVLTVTGGWDEAVDLFRTRLEGDPAEPSSHAYLAGALRRAGREQEAAEVEQLLEKLVMGDAATCLTVAGAYSFAGDFQRAAGWQRRALLEGDPEGEEFPVAVQSLKISALSESEWKLAAALCEVEAVLGMERERIYEGVPLLKLRTRFEADFARAMSLLDENRESALQMIENCHSKLPSDGMIADYFLPGLRGAGLTAEHDRYFDQTWERLEEVIRRFPGSHNTRNTAAWIAARAARRLDGAQGHLEAALERRPRQAAYLDTMAEVCFARGDRERAIEWSSRAVARDLTDSMLRRQLRRFRDGEFPVR
jgi:tetratricopeptide (TPR) repeat protein